MSKYALLYGTTKLKRMKIMRQVCQIIILIIGSPFLLMYCIGRLGESIYSLILHCYDMFEEFVVKTFKWNDIAKKQYESNPDKFN